MGEWLGEAGQHTRYEWSYTISEEKADLLFKVINIYQIEEMKNKIQRLDF